MISNENLDKLYNNVLNDTELTTKELSTLGFTSRDLNILIEEGTLVRVKRGVYALNSVDKLFCYGKKLIAQKEHDKADLCFLKCFQMDPSHIATGFQLFLSNIQKKDYDNAFKYFKVLYDDKKNEFLNRNNNFYLYLLNMIMELPEKYREYAKYLKYEDFKIDDINDESLLNRIRFSSYKQKFYLALKQLNDLTNVKGNRTSLVLIRYLINQAIAVQIENREKVLDFIKQKEYAKVSEFYEELSNKHNLSFMDEVIVILINDLLDLTSSKKIPVKKIFSTDNFYEAINGKNYELALNLVLEYNEKMNINNENSSIYILLREIINICKEIENKTLKKEVKEKDNFVNINEVLSESGVNNSSNELKEFYEFLILSLTKISLLEKDVKFTKPIEVFSLINSENYHFDISKCMQEFYTKLSQKKYEEARIYLDIIAKGNKVYKDNIAVEGLLQILEFSEKTVEDNKKLISEDKDQKDELSEKTFDKEKVIDEERNSEKKFLDKKYEKLLVNKGIVLLKPMNDDRIENVLKILSSYKDVDVFVIEYESKKQIVLRYRPVKDTWINVKELIQSGNNAYLNKNYNECIKNYLEVLPVFNKPSSYIYSKLGLAYMKSGKKSLAIDYLTVASFLAKKEGNNYDYSDLIIKLKGEIPEEDIKPNFIMTEEDFDYSDVSDYYGIENFAEINNYIIESGLDVENACRELGLTYEQTDIMKLIYAREFYTKANYEKGDLFLKSFEESQNKTKKTKKLFDEIRKNKRFYKNRDTNNNQLVLTLLPKKKNNV